ncbi:acyl-CoA dehydrogenase family protein [Isoalcanivorax indicus]|uniref:acyl-CoA dehydrogenase family protein n=1 Tax=Isoalcanivorax indicus TaxID=2202653 RepID=UPI000DB99191|nr:acyl-CoA dehydrogenase family protein [Isoalcanivorax indicus]
MDFQLSEFQQMLRDSAQRFVRQQHAFEQRRALLKESAGLHPALWQQFAELGWLALPFPEDKGGLGGQHRDLVQIMEAFGEGLVIEPYVANVLLAGTLIARCGSSAQVSELLEPMVAGALQLAFAHDEAGRRFSNDVQAVTATQDGDEVILQGSKSRVLNGDQAEQLVVSARLGDDVALFVVPANHQGVQRQAWAAVDGASGAEIHFDTVRIPAAARLGSADARADISAAQDLALLGLCAEAVGMLQALVRDTVEYTRTRKQFGVPISSFQVLQHRMVDMFMRAEQASALLDMAAIQMDAADATAGQTALSTLKVWLGSAGRLVGQQAVQLHGGMGVTEELRVGHYFKRLTLIEQLLGNEDWHLRRLDRLSSAA